MSHPSRRSTSRPVIALAGVALVVIGCGIGSGAPTSAAPESNAASTSPAVASSSPLAPPTADTTPVPVPSVGPAATPGQTKTAWGTIWDAVPPGFPRYPGSEPTETGAGPASATLSVPANVSMVATWMQSALERAGYSTEAMSGPFEDGSMVIDSVGPTSAQCRVETKIAPLGGTTVVTVLYGAACPPG